MSLSGRSSKTFLELRARSLNTPARVVVKCPTACRVVGAARACAYDLPYSLLVTSNAVGVVAATTLASAVEFVEALTIVLAMGTTRGWRSTWAGVGAALAALAVITALAGYALQSWLPEALLQLVVGTLLLIFGLQWLRKAILRAAGLKALHDEEDAFRSEVEAARAAGDERRLGLDWFAFVVSFKGVFLEGLEIVFIVITFGLNADSIALAVARRGDRRRASCSPPASRCTSRSRACPRTRSSSPSGCCSAPSAPSGPSRAWAGSRPTTRA